jgi:hypothetical protein
MSSLDIGPGILTFRDSQSQIETAVMAVLGESEFESAQLVIPDLAAQLNHGDWLDRREGFQIGLAMAGVDVKTVEVALSPFLAWCRLTERLPSERALDAFAWILLMLQNPPGPEVLALVRRNEFEANSRRVEAFAAYADYDRWLRHREERRQKISASGGRFEELPIHVADLVEWGKCLGESLSEPLLDRYATLLLEYLAGDFAR